MTLVQKEIKRVTIRPNGTEKQIRPVGWQPGANTFAYYPLTSTTTVNDMSGNNRTLTNYSSVSFGTQGGVDCATFNGSNYLGIGSQVFDLSQFTISCYVRVTSTNSRGICVIGMDNHIAYQSMVVFWESGSTKKFACAPYATSSYMNGSYEYNTWAHVVCVYDGTNYTIYVNGIQGGSNTHSVSIVNGGVIHIGKGAYGENKHYGQISEVIIENKVRTTQEIISYHNQTKSPYGIS